MGGVGFLGVAVLQTHRAGMGAGRAVVAAVGMFGVLVPVAAALRRPRTVPDSASADSPGGPGAPFGEGGIAASTGPIERLARLTERAVSLVQTRPGAVTALVGGLGAAGAYSHAETGRPGSLMAALVEASAVVVFAGSSGRPSSCGPAPRHPAVLRQAVGQRLRAATATIGTGGGLAPSEPRKGLVEKSKMPPSAPTMR